MLTENGSIVLELGNTWEPGKPVMSTIVMEALLRFLRRGGLHLCQEFVWYNPARLPGPAQWVNVERIRVKDSFTRIWWMSPTDRPKADNRRVLRQYSKSMTTLMQKKRYNSGVRPSAHRVGKTSFFTNNGGAIPPSVFNADELNSLSNVLRGANTRSRDGYQSFCRENQIPLHPARMPLELAEFFIRFLTDPNDTVFDPFAGSNTTGAAAEALQRNWVGCEAEPLSATTSLSRFPPSSLRERTLPKETYSSSTANPALTS
jgi:site-specific DNA-methyltransferase (cytosine-N4-specific)